MSKELPVEVNVFDVLYYEGKSYIEEPIRIRRALVEKIIDEKELIIRPSHALITSDETEASKFYDEAVKRGMEGVMMKNYESPYKAGARVGTWIKLKPTMETLDLVIVAAEWGEGKRGGWLTSFTLACLDDEGEVRTIGKVGTGIKELEDAGGVTFKEFTERLKPLVIHESGREVDVKPEIVVEVKFNEIQKSPTYTSGFALRFPRIVKIREDRGVEDVSTLQFIEDMT